MNREEFYGQPFKKDSYKDLGTGNDVKLPVTIGEFEELLAEVSKRARLHDVDDDMRQVLCGWIHHIPNTQDSIKISDLMSVLTKSVSNSLTWKIDQEIKFKRVEEAKALADKAKLEQGNVVNMPPRPTPGMDAKS